MPQPRSHAAAQLHGDVKQNSNEKCQRSGQVSLAITAQVPFVINASVFTALASGDLCASQAASNPGPSFPYLVLKSSGHDSHLSHTQQPTLNRRPFTSLDFLHTFVGISWATAFRTLGQPTD